MLPGLRPAAEVSARLLQLQYHHLPMFGDLRLDSRNQNVLVAACCSRLSYGNTRTGEARVSIVAAAAAACSGSLAKNPRQCQRSAKNDDLVPPPLLILCAPLSFDFRFFRFFLRPPSLSESSSESAAAAAAPAVPLVNASGSAAAS